MRGTGVFERHLSGEWRVRPVFPVRSAGVPACIPVRGDYEVQLRNQVCSQNEGNPVKVDRLSFIIFMAVPLLLKIIARAVLEEQFF